MTAEVEIYRTDDYLSVGRVPLVPLLQHFFEPMLGRSLAGCRFHLLFLPVAEDGVLPGPPELVNLRGSHGYVQVRIVQAGGDDTVLYRHPHPVSEVIAGPLQEQLAKAAPAETHWGFGVVAPGFDGRMVRPTPAVDGVIGIRTSGTVTPLFHLEEVAEPDPPLATLEDLGVTDPAPAHGSVAVVVAADVHAQFDHEADFSREVEEGGFLAGHVHRDSADPTRLLVEITAALAAERTGASMLHFTFTGESFLRIARQLIRRGNGERLVGWYHTHLFSASDRLGLSSIDVDLHLTTFRRPWQVAGLVNLDRTSRVLRFYHRAPDASAAPMELSPYWVAAP
ncbi:JAB N-terminal domain-containing protein [Cryptosporangium phraense]|uniref:JAB-N domain-containing protein n=1 Tax=Cryptosporangium phraense TaxID=2593070 RepID=A0A545AZJ8_9ACTN|nr:JAB N-terminal domain-containing protein [Cryptosporangium phraense]TQS46761.1 hypothetical protein FL583_00320 [Cryptosporangium phraense]